MTDEQLELEFSCGSRDDLLEIHFAPDSYVAGAKISARAVSGPFSGAAGEFFEREDLRLFVNGLEGLLAAHAGEAVLDCSTLANSVRGSRLRLRVWPTDSTGHFAACTAMRSGLEGAHAAEVTVRMAYGGTLSG